MSTAADKLYNGFYRCIFADKTSILSVTLKSILYRFSISKGNFLSNIFQSNHLNQQ